MIYGIYDQNYTWKIIWCKRISQNQYSSRSDETGTKILTTWNNRSFALMFLRCLRYWIGNFKNYSNKWKILTALRIFISVNLGGIHFWKSIGVPSRHEMSLRDLNQIYIERDISETSYKHLKGDDFFLTSLRRLKYKSRKMTFCDVFKTSQKFVKKYVFSVTSKKHLSQVFVVFQKNPPYWFRVISVGLLQYLIK